MAETLYGKTPLGQFMYDVGFSNKKISYLERKWKRKHLQPYRYLLRATLRGDKKAARYWRTRWERAKAMQAKDGKRA